jgi:hypothetical protein
MLGLFAIPTTALARESLDPDRTCYVAGKNDTVTINGSGFAPNMTFTAYSGDQPGPEEGDDLNLNINGTTGPDGGIHFSFPTYKLEYGGRYSPTITVRSDDQNSSASFYAETKVRMTSYAAGFYAFQKFGGGKLNKFAVLNSPSNANPSASASGKVRAYYKDKFNFFGYAWGEGTLPSTPAYMFVHYVDPRGKNTRDEPMAAVRACGEAETLSGHFLFRGLKKPKPGLWRFQFDTSKRYSPNTKQARSVYVKVDRKGYATFPRNVVYDYPG